MPWNVWSPSAARELAAIQTHLESGTSHQENHGTERLGEFLRGFPGEAGDVTRLTPPQRIEIVELLGLVPGSSWIHVSQNSGQPWVTSLLEGRRELLESGLHTPAGEGPASSGGTPVSSEQAARMDAAFEAAESAPAEPLTTGPGWHPAVQREFDDLERLLRAGENDPISSAVTNTIYDEYAERLGNLLHGRGRTGEVIRSGRGYAVMPGGLDWTPEQRRNVGQYLGSMPERAWAHMRENPNVEWAQTLREYDEMIFGEPSSAEPPTLEGLREQAASSALAPAEAAAESVWGPNQPLIDRLRARLETMDISSRPLVGREQLVVRDIGAFINGWNPQALAQAGAASTPEMEARLADVRGLLANFSDSTWGFVAQDAGLAPSTGFTNRIAGAEALLQMHADLTAGGGDVLRTGPPFTSRVEPTPGAAAWTAHLDRSGGGDAPAEPTLAARHPIQAPAAPAAAPGRSQIQQEVFDQMVPELQRAMDNDPELFSELSSHLVSRSLPSESMQRFLADYFSMTVGDDEYVRLLGGRQNVPSRWSEGGPLQRYFVIREPEGVVPVVKTSISIWGESKIYLNLLENMAGESLQRMGATHTALAVLSQSVDRENIVVGGGPQAFNDAGLPTGHPSDAGKRLQDLPSYDGKPAGTPSLYWFYGQLGFDPATGERAPRSAWPRPELSLPGVDPVGWNRKDFISGAVYAKRQRIARKGAERAEATAGIAQEKRWEEMQQRELEKMDPAARARHEAAQKGISGTQLPLPGIMTEGPAQAPEGYEPPPPPPPEAPTPRGYPTPGLSEEEAREVRERLGAVNEPPLEPVHVRGPGPEGPVTIRGVEWESVGHFRVALGDALVGFRETVEQGNSGAASGTLDNILTLYGDLQNRPELSRYRELTDRYVRAMLSESRELGDDVSSEMHDRARQAGVGGNLPGASSSPGPQGVPGGTGSLADTENVRAVLLGDIEQVQRSLESGQGGHADPVDALAELFRTQEVAAGLPAESPEARRAYTAIAEAATHASAENLNDFLVSRSGASSIRTFVDQTRVANAQDLMEQASRGLQGVGTRETPMNIGHVADVTNRLREAELYLRNVEEGAPGLDYVHRSYGQLLGSIPAGLMQEYIRVQRTHLIPQDRMSPEQGEFLRAAIGARVSLPPESILQQISTALTEAEAEPAAVAEPVAAAPEGRTVVSWPVGENSTRTTRVPEAMQEVRDLLDDAADESQEYFRPSTLFMADEILRALYPVVGQNPEMEELSSRYRDRLATVPVEEIRESAAGHPPMAEFARQAIQARQLSQHGDVIERELRVLLRETPIASERSPEAAERIEGLRQSRQSLEDARGKLGRATPWLIGAALKGGVKPGVAQAEELVAERPRVEARREVPPPAEVPGSLKPPRPLPAVEPTPAAAVARRPQSRAGTPPPPGQLGGEAGATRPKGVDPVGRWLKDVPVRSQAGTAADAIRARAPEMARIPEVMKVVQEADYLMSAAHIAEEAGDVARAQQLRLTAERQFLSLERVAKLRGAARTGGKVLNWAMLPVIALDVYGMGKQAKEEGPGAVGRQIAEGAEETGRAIGRVLLPKAAEEALGLDKPGTLRGEKIRERREQERRELQEVPAPTEEEAAEAAEFLQYDPSRALRDKWGMGGMDFDSIIPKDEETKAREGAAARALKGQ